MNRDLLIPLIQNAGLLLAMVVAFDFLTTRRDLLGMPLHKAIAGLAIGGIGIAMIVGSVPLETGIIFDTRSVLLAVTGLFLGGWPTAIATAMIATYRLAMGGAAAGVGAGVVLASGVIGVALRRVRRRPLEDVSWKDLYALGLVVHAVMLAILFTLPGEVGMRVIRAVGIPVMLVHPAATVALGLLFVQRLRHHATVMRLSESEARFRLLAENAGDLIYLSEYTPTRAFTYVSPSAGAITGYSPEEHYADPELMRKLIHPEDRPLLQAEESGPPSPDHSRVVRWIRKDGAVIWVEERTTHIRDTRGNLTVVGIVRDITASREADALLRMTLRAANQGLWDLNVQTGEAKVSAEYARMIGEDPASFRETNDAWLERVHPDDRPAAGAAYQDYIDGRAAEYRVEFRQRTRAGGWMWILSLGSLVAWDEAGKPLRMMGTHTDITALKAAEQAIIEAEAATSRLLAEAEQSRRALLSLVEDQQAAERKLLETQHLAQSTLDALTENICVLDETGAIIMVNDAWCEFGEKNEGQPSAILAGANYLAVCDGARGSEAEQAREVAAALRAVLAGERDTFSAEYPCHMATERRWFEVRITRFAAGGHARVVVAHENVTERRKAESELRRLTQILEASQAAARVGAWELDVVNDTLLWTDETYRIHDTSPAEYRPTLATAIKFFTQESVHLVREALREAIENGVAHDAEVELITSTGRRKWVHLAPSLSVEGGRTVRVTCAIQDITARKEAERERLELTAQLHQVQKLESLGILAGGVAHDLNNVLAAILSGATAQRQRLGEFDPQVRSYDTIIKACERGRSVVRSLLYFARTDVESRGAVDLNAIAREIVNLLDSTTLKRIRLTTDLEQQLGVVDGDAAALSHAVMNLCVNSVDAMPDGGAITIVTRTRPDGSVEIRVRDTGKGMTPEVREKAIEPFFTTKPVGKGTGLGLAMVYGTVKAHKGTLEIVSPPEGGTEVILGFPATPAELAAQAMEVTTVPDGSVASVQPQRILVVDDDDLIREAVSLLLEVEGHEVHVAESGAEAIALFESGLAVDLVLLDMNMPDLNGGQTLTRLLAIRPNQLVLMCSGNADEEMRSMMTGRSNVLGLQKPFTLEEFVAKRAALDLSAGGSDIQPAAV